MKRVGKFINPLKLSITIKMWLKSKFSKIRFPIRAKIMTLLAGSLTISLLSYLSIATSLFVEDKVSYIYDYNLAKIKAVADSIDNQISKASVLASTAGHLLASKDANRGVVEETFRDLNVQLGVSALLYLRPTSERRFTIVESHGTDSEKLQRMLAESGWTPAEFAGAGILIGKANQGAVPVGGKTVDALGRPLAYLFLLSPLKALLDSPGKNFSVYLLDRSGNPLSASTTPRANEREVTKPIFSSIPTGFNSGVREMQVEGSENIIGYQKLEDGALTALGLIPKEAAFTAQRALVRRSFVLGLSVLLIALGVALVLVRSLTRRLRQMWHATQKVSEGDFSVRVATDGATEDEVTSLAVSFNAMSGKIKELLAETVKKARMEKELETAQIVQSRFFPTTGFDHSNLKLSGRFVPASECSGDWWQYALIGDQLIIVLGDVTGHGVSAALVTAAAHAGFSMTVADWKTGTKGPLSITTLAEKLHQAVVASAGGQASMTFAAAEINLKTGMMVFANAGHPPPFLYRDDRSKPLMGAMNHALGERGPVSFHTSSIQLQAGDRIFWYSDGVFEARRKDRKKISKMGLVRSLEEISSRAGFNAQSICDTFMSQTIAFFGNADERPDDITFMAVVIPKGAQFELPQQKAEAEKAA